MNKLLITFITAVSLTEFITVCAMEDQKNEPTEQQQLYKKSFQGKLEELDEHKKKELKTAERKAKREQEIANLDKEFLELQAKHNRRTVEEELTDQQTMSEVFTFKPFQKDDDEINTQNQNNEQAPTEQNQKAAKLIEAYKAKRFEKFNRAFNKIPKDKNWPQNTHAFEQAWTEEGSRIAQRLQTLSLEELEAEIQRLEHENALLKHKYALLASATPAVMAAFIAYSARQTAEHYAHRHPPAKNSFDARLITLDTWLKNHPLETVAGAAACCFLGAILGDLADDGSLIRPRVEI